MDDLFIHTMMAVQKVEEKMTTYTIKNFTLQANYTYPGTNFN